VITVLVPDSHVGLVNELLVGLIEQQILKESESTVKP
jgi:hypothetical protein